MASKAYKRKKGTTRVVIRLLDGESDVGQRRGLSGTFEYQDEGASTADFQQPRGGGWSSDEVVVEDILVCIFCNWEASSFPKLSHHVGYVHKVGYKFWCDLVKKNYHVLDGISYVRKTTSRQIQWGRVP